MSDLIGTAIYTKNISTPERLLRLAAALAMIVAALFVAEPWLKWALGGSGVMAMATGLFGFCPACYLAGRKFVRKPVQ